MSGDPDNLWEVVNYDYNTANLTLQIKQDDTKSLKAALNAVKKYEAEFNHMAFKSILPGQDTLPWYLPT